MKNLYGWAISVAALATGTVVACGTSSAPDTAIEKGSWQSSSSGDLPEHGTGGDHGYGAGGGWEDDWSSPEPLPPPPEEELNCDGLNQDEPLVLYLSADDSNSMVSPTVARRYIAQGIAPHTSAHAVRTYEFLNYYNIDYPAADANEVNVYPQMALGDEEGTFDLQIGVRSFDLAVDRPKTLTFSLDTSGSMSGEAIQNERAVLLAIAKQLKKNDIVNIVTWSTDQAILLDGHIVSGPNDPTVVQIAQSIEADGGTNLAQGLETAYELATEHYAEERLNRVVLISDGVANVGITQKELVAQHSADADKEGIYLLGVGTGAPNQFADGMMNAITDLGRGAYIYIDSAGEADAVFNERFNEVMEIAARAVQVELTLPWYFQMKQFHGEEFSEDPEEVEPQHLAPNDAMVLNQVIKPCDVELVDENDNVEITVRWSEPLTYKERETTKVMSIGALLSGDTTQLKKGKAIVAYAEALKSGAPEDLSKAYELLDAMNDADADVSEIKQLLSQHPSFVSE